MKYIIALLLTVALLFSIVTGRAGQPTALPSGAYYLSFTTKEGKTEEREKNLPVRLTTKIKNQESASSGDRTVILTDIVIESDHRNLWGRAREEYDKGKLIDGFIVLSMTTPMAGGFE
jgi:hypothetical protein